MPTILITGSSSGFGLETGRVFRDRGWNVLATMRSPDSDALPPSENLRTLQLDVTDPMSVTRAGRSPPTISECCSSSSCWRLTGDGAT